MFPLSCWPKVNKTSSFLLLQPFKNSWQPAVVEIIAPAPAPQNAPSHMAGVSTPWTNKCFRSRFEKFGSDPNRPPLPPATSQLLGKECFLSIFIGAATRIFHLIARIHIAPIRVWYMAGVYLPFWFHKSNNVWLMLFFPAIGVGLELRLFWLCTLIKICWWFYFNFWFIKGATTYANWNSDDVSTN